MNKFKEFMDKPYTKGDYYGGIAAVVVLYGAAFAAFAIKAKLEEKAAMNAIDSKIDIEFPDEEDDEIL